VQVAQDGAHHVPKKELVTCLQLLLQNRRLHVAGSLREAKVLVRELRNFQVKATAAANETFGARERRTLSLETHESTPESTCPFCRAGCTIPSRL
jgi:hypothetical protein